MSQPNIVLILLDDYGWRDTACYGSSFYETPNLDRLASQGMLFTDAYASCPVCSPTRASVMTGKYPATVGITNFIAGNPWGKLKNVPYVHHLPEDEVTLAHALGRSGYQTWHVGKWHVGGPGHEPHDVGFDVNIGGGGVGMPHSGYFSPWNLPNLENGPEGKYLTDHLTDEAIRLIENAGDKPYFLNMWHYAVHTPIQAPADLIAKYEEKAKALGLDKLKTFEEGEPFGCLHKKDQRVVRRLLQSDPVYAAMIENLDWNIGRLMEAIDASGQAENTIVLFTSDNGGLATAEGSPTCNAPLAEGKGWMYDGGVREPLIIRWPKVVQPGSRCNTPVTSTDYYPTLLEAAGLPLMPEQHVDGVSTMPLLRGVGSLQRDAIFWHYPHYSQQGGDPACAVRSGDWKLIEFYEDWHLELYNLRHDIGEQHNLVREQPEVARDLHERLVAWRESVEAKIPEVNPWWEDMVAGRVPCPNGKGEFPEGVDSPFV